MTARSRITSALQALGRALMLPVAVLPIAGILLRLGQPDVLDIAFIAAAGDAIFASLGLIFAIGVAVGLARENHGASGLAGAIAYLVLTEGAKALLAVPADVTEGLAGPMRDLAIPAWKAKQLARLSVPAGILSGVTAGWLYNRYATIRLPEYLAFFGGRRFVPIAAGFAGLLGAAIFGWGFPVLAAAIDTLSQWVVGLGPLGLFLYGVLNRLLIVTGLHHILNNIAWFVIGDFHGATGDIKRFFAGDPTAGTFTSGFFPVMIFGLPAACLAMYRAALPLHRKRVGGIMLSLALTAMLTGVTEPVEYTFMFVAPALYAMHALLTGVAMVVMNFLGVKLGFGFSAGLIDYVLNYGLATRPLLLLPVGAGYAVIYYFAFAWAIRRFNLPTPGREADPVLEAAQPSDLGAAYTAALGGAANLEEVAACTTRLRLKLSDPAAIDETRLKSLGARAVVRVGERGLQVIIGPDADRIAGEIGRTRQAAPAAPAQAITTELAPEIIAALGGRENILSVNAPPGRMIVEVKDLDLTSTDALSVLRAGKWARPHSRFIHLLI